MREFSGKMGGDGEILGVRRFEEIEKWRVISMRDFLGKMGGDGKFEFTVGRFEETEKGSLRRPHS